MPFSSSNTNENTKNPMQQSQEQSAKQIKKQQTLPKKNNNTATWLSRAEKNRIWAMEIAEGFELAQHNLESDVEKIEPQPLQSKPVKLSKLSRMKDLKKMLKMKKAAKHRQDCAEQLKALMVGNFFNADLNSLTSRNVITSLQHVFSLACDESLDQLEAFLERICRHYQTSLLLDTPLNKATQLLGNTVYTVFSLANRYKNSDQRRAFLNSDVMLQRNIRFLMRCLDKKGQENFCFIIAALTQVNKQSELFVQDLHFEKLTGFVKSLMRSYAKPFFRLHQDHHNTARHVLIEYYQASRIPNSRDLGEALANFWKLHYHKKHTISASFKRIGISLEDSLVLLVTEQSKAASRQLPYGNGAAASEAVDINNCTDADLDNNDEFYADEYYHESKSRGRAHRVSVAIEKEKGHRLFERTIKKTAPHHAQSKQDNTPTHNTSKQNRVSLRQHGLRDCTFFAKDIPACEMKGNYGSITDSVKSANCIRLT